MADGAENNGVPEVLAVLSPEQFSLIEGICSVMAQRIENSVEAKMMKRLEAYDEECGAEEAEASGAETEPEREEPTATGAGTAALQATATVTGGVDGEMPGPSTSKASPDSGPTGATVAAALLKKFGKVEKCGTDISAEMVDLIRGVCSNQTQQEEEKVLLPPGNVPELKPTKMNEAIWTALPAKAKSVDLKFQAVQKSLLQGMIKLAYACEALATSKAAAKIPEIQELTEAVTDSLVSFAKTNVELNRKRLDQIKPELNKEYATLCNAVPEPGKDLLGDDVGQRVKDISEAAKTGSRAVHRFQPYTTGRGHSTRGGGFRGRGRAFGAMKAAFGRGSSFLGQQQQAHQASAKAKNFNKQNKNRQHHYKYNN